MLPYSKNLKQYSRELRKSTTDAKTAMVEGKVKTTEYLSVLQAEYYW